MDEVGGGGNSQNNSTNLSMFFQGSSNWRTKWPIKLFYLPSLTGLKNKKNKKNSTSQCYGQCIHIIKSQDLNIFSVQDVLSLVCLFCKIMNVFFFMKFCVLRQAIGTLGTQEKISSLNEEFPFTATYFYNHKMCQWNKWLYCWGFYSFITFYFLSKWIYRHSTGLKSKEGQGDFAFKCSELVWGNKMMRNTLCFKFRDNNNNNKNQTLYELYN